MLRFHTQTAGSTLTAQQPENNVVRVALQALAAVLGGTQSLHTNSMDEALALPSERSVRVALRTQQIIAHESGVANTVDPLAGSYFVESLTNRLEEEVFGYLSCVETMGGTIRAITSGYLRAGDRHQRLPLPEEVEEGRARRRWREPLRHRRARADRTAASVDPMIQDVQLRSAWPTLRARPKPGECASFWPIWTRAARGDENLHAASGGVCGRLLHAGRDVRRAANGLRHVSGDGGSVSGEKSDDYPTDRLHTDARHERRAGHRVAAGAGFGAHGAGCAEDGAAAGPSHSVRPSRRRLPRSARRRPQRARGRGDLRRPPGERAGRRYPGQPRSTWRLWRRLAADTGAPVRIGNQSNVQDGVVVHSSEGQSFAVDGKRYAVYIGSRVSLAHQCLVHGPAALYDDVFVGFGSMVINSTVGKGTVVMHMAFVSDVDVPAGRMVPPGTVVNTPEQARALPRVPANVREWADGVARGNRDRARALSKARR